MCNVAGKPKLYATEGLHRLKTDVQLHRITTSVCVTYRNLIINHKKNKERKKKKKTHTANKTQPLLLSEKYLL